MREISIEITHDCALKCIFCSSSADHPSPLGELALEKISSILDEAVVLGTEVVSLSGGEPLLHSRFFDILSEIQKHKMKAYLYTSGITINSKGEYLPIDTDVWDKIKRIVKSITVIFDFQSKDQEIVEHLNGIKGTYKIIMESISNAMSCGIMCEAHMIPMKPNYLKIPETITFCKNLGFSKISFLRFVPQGRAIENIAGLALSAKEFLKLQHILLNEVKKHGEYIRLGHPIDFLFIFEKQQVETYCRGGHDAPLVLPNGDVHVCPAWKQLKQYAAGNIFTNTLTNIWNDSEYFLEFRKITLDPSNIKGLCNKCASLSFCRGGCTAQRILSLLDTRILFPAIMYTSPDPDCPLVHNFSLANEMQKRGVNYE